MVNRNARRIARERAERMARRAELRARRAEQRARRAERRARARRTTFVIVLSDLCNKFTLEAPTYQDIRESGDNPDRIFWIGLTFLEFGLSGI